MESFVTKKFYILAFCCSAVLFYGCFNRGAGNIYVQEPSSQKGKIPAETIKAASYENEQQNLNITSYKKINKTNDDIYKDYAELLIKWDFLTSSEKEKSLKNLVGKYPDSDYLMTGLAQFYFQRGALDKALKAIEPIKNRNSQSLEAYMTLGKIYIAKGQLEEAKDVFLKCIEIEPKSLPALEELASISYAQEKFADSIGYAEKLLRVDQRNIGPGYIHIGKCYYELGEYENALKYFEMVIEMYPTYAYAYVLAGKVNQKLKNFDKSVEAYNRALSIHNDILDAYIGLGDINMEKEEYKEAYNNFMRADHLATDGLSALFVSEKLSILCFYAEKYEEAISHLQKYLTLSDSTNADYLAMLGYAFEKTGQKEQAIETYKKIVELKEDNLDIIVRIAALEEELGNFESAIEILDRAVEKGADKREVFLVQAAIHKDAGQLDKALEIYNDILLATSDNYTANFQSAVIYESKNEVDKSAEHLERLLKLYPADPSLYNFIAYMYADRGINLQKAEEYALKAILIEPQDGYIADTVGWVYFK